MKDAQRNGAWAEFQFQEIPTGLRFLRDLETAIVNWRSLLRAIVSPAISYDSGGRRLPKSRRGGRGPRREKSPPEDLGRSNGFLNGFFCDLFSPEPL